MRKYELAISPEYVANWTVVDAIRELFQNALDQDKEDNPWFYTYIAEQVDMPGQLRIGNRQSILSIQSLLLGSTTKKDDKNTIGQFGEGYKIATLVLLRLGKKITFYNYGAREVWKPRFVDSRRYGTKVLTFFVDDDYLWDVEPDNYLSIVVEGITDEEYHQLVESNLHMQPTAEVIETEQGQILLDEKQKGRVYVNGLFICTHKPYHLGYNFKPAHIELDRDRKLVSDFELQWMASKMWAGTQEVERIVALAKAGAADVEYVNSHLITKLGTEDAALIAFQNEHGSNAVPVVYQSDLAEVPDGYTPVIVPEPYCKLVKRSSMYVPPIQVPKITIKERLQDWFEDIEDRLEQEEVDQFQLILDDIED